MNLPARYELFIVVRHSLKLARDAFRDGREAARSPWKGGQFLLLHPDLKFCPDSPASSPRWWETCQGTPPFFLVCRWNIFTNPQLYLGVSENIIHIIAPNSNGIMVWYGLSWLSFFKSVNLGGTSLSDTASWPGEGVGLGGSRRLAALVSCQHRPQLGEVDRKGWNYIVIAIWMVYNGKSHKDGWFWGYPYFRKPPYDAICIHLRT